MRRAYKFGGLAVFSLILAVLLAACSATNTAIPAAKPTDAAMAKPTDAAMAKPTDAAMMKPTDAAMAKPTDAAMMKPTDAAMMKPTDAAMAKPTDAAMMKPVGPFTGDFNNQGAEAVAGKASIGKTTDGKLTLRLDNLKSANGPDLYVYLTKVEAPSTNDQIKAGFEVGKLKATTGNLNYDIDASVDLSQYKAVAIYCKSVSVVFGYANLKLGVS